MCYPPRLSSAYEPGGREGKLMRTTARQTRENRTITVDFQNEATYVQLLGDGKAFVECVLAFLLALGFQLKHR